MEYLYRKRFDSKLAEPNGGRVTGRGGSEYRNRLWRGEG